MLRTSAGFTQIKATMHTLHIHMCSVCPKKSESPPGQKLTQQSFSCNNQLRQEEAGYCTTSTYLFRVMIFFCQNKYLLNLVASSQKRLHIVILFLLLV